MNWTEIAQLVLEVVIIPLLGVAVGAFCSWIKNKNAALKAKVSNETAQMYMDKLTDTVTRCVIATNQTYVDALKKNGAFTLEAQKIAFDTTKATVLALLTEEAKDYLTCLANGDLNKLVDTMIEAITNNLKQ